MTNIFTDLDNLSTNDLRVELALINNINLTNVARETGNRVVGALARFAGSIVQSVSVSGTGGSDSDAGYDVTTMSDIIRKNYDELAGISRDELKDNIRITLTARCQASVGAGVQVTEERASYMIVSEAAKMYSSPKFASFANKVHDIGIYYNKGLSQAVHEMIKRQSTQEAKELDERLQKRLDIISIESKRELSNRLFPKEFSGRGIANVLRLEKGTRYLDIAISIMGIECFDCMAAYAAASVKALKGLNGMRRSVYAQLIWKIYGITDDYRVKLPSYINTVKAPEVVAQENEFRQMLKNRVDADKELDRLRAQLEKNAQDKEKMLEKLNDAQNSYDAIKLEFDGLEKDKDTYMSGVRPEAETKKYYSQVNLVKRSMDSAESELEEVRSKYTALITSGNELENTISMKEVYSQKLRSQTNSQLRQVTGELKKRWNEYYTSIIFSDDVYGQAVLAFSRDELLCVEQGLAEFMELEDKTALDVQTGLINVSVSETAVAHIRHEGVRIMDISR